MASKTRWIIAALVLIAALALSACQPVLTPPQSSPPAAESPTQAPAAEPVVITLAYNRFLQTSFDPGPAPIDLIREEVASTPTLTCG